MDRAPRDSEYSVRFNSEFQITGPRGWDPAIAGEERGTVQNEDDGEES